VTGTEIILEESDTTDEKFQYTDENQQCVDGCSGYDPLVYIRTTGSILDDFMEYTSALLMINLL
jgi:hypothetical protein